MDKLHTTESVVHCSYCNAAHTIFPTVKYHSLASIKWLNLARDVVWDEKAYLRVSFSPPHSAQYCKTILELEYKYK